MSAYSFPIGSASDSDVTQVAQVAHGFSVGDWVRMDGTDYVLAQADTEANAEVVGVVSAVADVDNFTLTTGGLVSGLSGLTAGEIHYLDDAVAGAVIATDTAAVSKPVLIARSTSSGYVFNGFGSGGNGAAGTHSIGMSNLGNTSGTTGVVSGSQIRMLFAGGNNITLSQSLNGASGTLTISAPNTSSLVGVSGVSISTAGSTISLIGSPFSAGVSNVGNTAGNTGITGSRLVLAGTNGITLSQSTNASGGTISISGATQTLQTSNVHNVTLSGNTAGAMAQVSSGTMTLAGGNNITLSQAGNAITISGANVGGAQTGISSIVASDATYTSGSVQFTGSGIVTVRSSANQRVVIDASQSVQPETQTFIAGISASDTLYTSGNVRITGVGGGITVSSNTGQRVDLSVAAQSVQPGVQQIVASNASFSSGTVSISGFGAATVNTAANIIRISVPVQTAETAISGIANSQTTYTSGTVSLSELGAITIRSTTGNQFQFSVNSQTLQTSNVHNVTLSGNTAGAMAQISSGTMTLAGGANITLSQAGNAVTISGAAGGAFSAGMSTEGNTAGATGVSGSRMVLVGSGPISLSQTTGAAGNTVSVLGPAVSSLVAGANITVSTDGSTISIIGGAGAGFSGGVSNVGNTAGDTGITGSRLVLAGGNGITLSQSTNASGGTVTVSGITQSVQPGVQQIVASNASFSSGTVSISGFGDVTVNTAAGIIRISAPVQTTQTGISGVANSQTTYTSGTVSLSELGAITIRSTTGNQYQFSVNSQTEQTQSRFNLTLSGNTAGALAGISSGVMTMAGGNNITLSQAGNAVTISGPNVGGAQTGISSIAASDTTYTSGQVQFTGSNMITVKSSANQRVVIDATQSVQPGVQQIVASDASFSSGTVSISGFGAATVNTAANIIRISVPTQTVQPGVQHLVASNNTFSSGTVSISGFGDITVNTAGSLIRVSGPVQTAETAISGLANSQTTYTSGTVSLSELGAITIRSTTGNQFQFSVNPQTEQTQSRFNLTISGNTAGAGALISSGVMTLAGGPNVTVSQAGNAVSISAGAGGAFSAGMSTEGNTAGATGVSGSRMVLVGSGPVSLSQTTGAAGNTVSILAPATSSLVAGANITVSTDGSTISIIGGAGGGFSGGVSNIGNTGGDTGMTATRLVFVGSNNVTLSQSTGANGATIGINAGGGGGFSGGVSTGGNTAGATGITGTQLVLVGGSQISLSQTTGANGGTVTINAPATSSLVGGNDISISTNGSTISVIHRNTLADWQNFPRQQASLISHVSGFSKTPIYWQDHLDGDVLAKSLAFAISMVTASQPLSVSVHLGVYTIVNSTSAAGLASHSEAYVVSSATSVSLSGVRNVIMTGIGTHGTLSSLQAGEYVFGMMFSATATNAMNFSLLGASGGPMPLGGLYPGTNNYSAGTSQGIQALRGRGSTTVNAMPAGIVATELVNQGTAASAQLQPWIYIRS